MGGGPVRPAALQTEVTVFVGARPAAAPEMAKPCLVELAAARVVLARLAQRGVGLGAGARARVRAQLYLEGRDRVVFQLGELPWGRRGQLCLKSLLIHFFRRQMFVRPCNSCETSEVEVSVLHTI